MEIGKILPYIVIVLFLVVLICGYASKKRISNRIHPKICRGNLELHCEYEIERRWLPFLAERAVIRNRNTSLGGVIPNLRIEAVSNRHFRILNAKDIAERGVVINGMKFGPDAGETLEHRRFGYRGFSMQDTLEKGPDGRTLHGTFYMT